MVSSHSSIAVFPAAVTGRVHRCVAPTVPGRVSTVAGRLGDDGDDDENGVSGADMSPGRSGLTIDEFEVDQTRATSNNLVEPDCSGATGKQVPSLAACGTLFTAMRAAVVALLLFAIVARAAEVRNALPANM